VAFTYIQTWVVREGYEETHDRLFKEWILRAKDDPSLRSIRFPPTLGSLSRKRILVYCFDDVEGWRCFRENTLCDYRVFVKQWLQFIDLNLFIIYFKAENR